ncbi:YolD-like family protein [Robertmurraya massiliosenegalensis]|uniref:YolD-like family protein n=1 Tax=Robertmurraya TaxID=2837507 RepID=UPI0039A70229
MLNDRGLMKWQPAHFMPEQRKLLSGLDLDNKKQKKPDLDEQELEEINIVIYESLNYTLTIMVETWEDGFFKRIEGIVNKIDYINKCVSIECDAKKIKIPIDHITKTERT